jgi:sortase (surface protein transpeptidase)
MTRRKRHNNNFKRLLPLRRTAGLLILLGLIVCSTNLYHYSRGLLTGWLFISTVGAREKDTQKRKLDVTLANENAAESDERASTDSTADFDRIRQIKNQLVYEDRPESGEQFGELYIPRLASTLPIVEGTEEEELELGVGHYAGSVPKPKATLTVSTCYPFRYIGAAPLRYVLMGHLSLITLNNQKYK